MLPRPRLFSLKIKRKLATLRVAGVVRKGGLLAHQTGTVAGVAAHPDNLVAIRRMQRFKQRKGPFLLLADSPATALAQARYITPALRKMAKHSWPGPVTLVFPAKPCHAAVCFKQGMMAVRVDSDVESRRLASLCGGLLLSSSLNRRGKPTMPLEHQSFWRFARLVRARILQKEQTGSSTPSLIYQLNHAGCKRLR